MKSKFLLTIFLLIISLSLNAEITTDGTLGSRANLPGPDYQIGADLGRQHGGNLFHSFQDFNLNSSESATFSGPNSLNNIISRVTGGNPSNIDGLIRSAVPADMYFLNPNGIMFGPNARLDVQGSFHASTADYLRLGENGRFDARNPSNSLLTVAPIASFGFLDNPHGKIEVNGRGVLNGSGTPRALLQVPDGKSLSLIGGDIYLSQGMDEEDFDKLLEDDTSKLPTPEEKRVLLELNQRYSQLRAPGGTINLASIQQAGEIALTKNGLHSTAIQSGIIQLEQQAFLSTTGENGGNLFIRAGQFIMTDSRFEAHTLGIEDGGLIDIQAETINLQNSDILAHPYNLGNGSDIQLNATESINIKESSIWNYSGGANWLNYELGNAGHVTLRAKNMALTNITIMPDTYTTGQAGNLTLMAENN
ncbi:MAG: filamentous hemagglutinin N-terminal domain-containing protein, partial [Candidatus Parabeggiatoa sp.]|nr:filamentous hemagglutinin N-terminal domain-containing protein [Candidatus Parabeggiatoa sp.]